MDEHKVSSKLKTELSETQAELEYQLKRNNFVENLFSQTVHTPKWLSSPVKGKKDIAIATAMLSDTHFDEVVQPDEINGVNAYGRDIATLRLKTFFENTVKLCAGHMAGLKIEGLVLALGGDMVSGNIHEELADTNEANIMDTVIYWTGQLIAGIELLDKHFKKIHVPCVTGNHGRNSIKKRNKGRAEDNFDWLMYHMVARHFEGRKTITFQIPRESEVRWTVYGTRYHMSHGDQFRGGAGIGGIAVPIMRGDAKKRTRESAVNTPYDHLLIGHFHQLKDLGSVLINGSLKGYDEYAASFNFDFELPRQLFFLTDPVHGKTISAPIHVICDKEKALWPDANKEYFSIGGAA